VEYEVPSPCTAKCGLQPFNNESANRICTGCGRTINEIGKWPKMDSVRRLVVLINAKKKLEDIKKFTQIKSILKDFNDI
jgi:predicted Fe-S protein YdhL (DUF1289 family)